MSEAAGESIFYHRESLRDEAATASLAARLAPHLRAGDVVLLEGDLGAGKTAFARALINALPGPAEEVPSPTFTLVQIYQRGGLEVWHCDLYRLEHVEEVEELGLEEAFASALVLIEWPDRLGPYRPAGALTVTLRYGEAGARRVAEISGAPAWRARLEELFA
jgi:tRNA threonylcarbamoyladenosine biosynthesis protein TsaE